MSAYDPKRTLSWPGGAPRSMSGCDPKGRTASLRVMVGLLRRRRGVGKGSALRCAPVIDHVGGLAEQVRQLESQEQTARAPDGVFAKGMHRREVVLRCHLIDFGRISSDPRVGADIKSLCLLGLDVLYGRGDISDCVHRRIACNDP